ncbi:SoxR reducing system RseC family protein [Helicobacter burdigaliensis]
MKVKNILLKCLRSNKLNTLEKLYFDLMFMITLSFISFLILSFKFFVYEDILVFFQDYSLLFIIFVIGLIGLFDTLRGIRKYKEILKEKELSLLQ